MSCHGLSLNLASLLVFRFAPCGAPISFIFTCLYLFIAHLSSSLSCFNPSMAAFNTLRAASDPRLFVSMSFIPPASQMPYSAPAITPVPSPAGFRSTRAGFVMAYHLVRYGRSFKRDPEEILLCVGKALPDGLGDFVGFSESQATLPFPSLPPQAR